MEERPETPLCKLALKYKTDKCKRRGKHTYTEYYYKLLKARKKTIKKVLEIGIGKGASLLMWRDFFPNATIYGADYRENFLIRRDRIVSILCDQRRKNHLVSLINLIGPDIDLVVEDASHRPRDQISTCLTLMPLLNKDAIYIIEDVADPSIVERLSQYDVFMPELDQSVKRYDNRLVVVRHKKKSKDKKINISFFAKTPYLVGPERRLTPVSSIIRAQQTASYIGAKLNPDQGYENDVCIYVKPSYKDGNDFLLKGKKVYLDVVDELGYCNFLRKHPEIGAISLSDWNFRILKKFLPETKIVNIPQQNCNFERLKRVRTEITTVGIIGSQNIFAYLPQGLKEALTQRGMKLVEFSKFATRQDIVNFYMNIDIQIVWRPYYNYNKVILVNPLKIVNASSFGIPTIAYSEPVFEEMEGCYIPVRTLPEFLANLDNLRSQPNLYDEYSKRCIEKAEEYHIEKIAEAYKNLL